MPFSHRIPDVPVHLFAAGTAAAVSTLAVQPLDVIKTRLQVHRVLHTDLPSGTFRNMLHIFTHEGAKGLYRGCAPSLICVVPSVSIYFTAYSEFKRAFGCPTGNQSKDTCFQSVSAGLASSITSAITNPLWLVKTRIQSQPQLKNEPQKYSKTMLAFRSIIKEEGIRGLYKGLGASFLTSTQAMLQFPLYEKLKSYICHPNQGYHNPLGFLTASSVAASISCLCTYPAEVVRSRMQVQGTHRHFPVKYTGLLHAFRMIWIEEGMRGLYRGLGTNLVRLTPAHAISFTAYEIIFGFLSLKTAAVLHAQEAAAPNQTPTSAQVIPASPSSPPK